MYKVKILIVLGVLLAFMPYLGFPISIKNILISLLSLGIIYIASMSLYNENKNKTRPTFENFSENRDFLEKK